MNSFAKVTSLLSIMLVRNCPVLADSFISAAAGFSSDTQQLTQTKCFIPTTLFISKPLHINQLNEAVYFPEMEKNLGIDLRTKGQYGMFASDEKENYTRSLEEKDSSISLNYYVSSSKLITAHFKRGGVEVLTTYGREYYNNAYNYRNFGLMCGDKYVASYKKGGLLIMSLKIQLSNHVEKEVFKKNANLKFNIVNALNNLPVIFVNFNISGSVKVDALQIGGEPNQLKNLLAAGSYDETTGSYSTCSHNEIEPCLKTATSLMEYTTYFRNQIFNDTMSKPLGIVSLESISRIDLTPPMTQVTREIAQYRDELVGKLQENEYYRQKIHSLLVGYPIELENPLRGRLLAFQNSIMSNLRALMNQESGAAICFNQLVRCKEVRDCVNSWLVNFSAVDLEFLNVIKEKIHINHGYYNFEIYGTGGDSKRSFGSQLFGTFNSFSLTEVSVGAKFCIINLRHRDDPFHTITYIGTWNGLKREYVGPIEERTFDTQKRIYNVPALLQVSPFFFQDYGTAISGIDDAHD